MVRLLVSKVAARSSARCLPLPCSSSTIAKRRSVRFICSPLPLLDCSLASPFSPSLPCSSLPYNLLIILSSIGFFFTVAGIVGSAIVLKYAHGQQEILAGGVIGLVSSIVVLLVCVAIFVIAVVALAIRTGRVRGRMGARM